MDKIRLIFAGSSIVSTYFLQVLIEDPNINVVSIITQPDKPQGRRKKIQPTPVKTMALTYQLRTLTPKSLYKPSFIEKVASFKPDIMLVASYAQIIPLQIINIPKHKTICFHPSLLPKYRGTTPIQTAILKEERMTGFTFFLMDEKIDHGPIIYQEKIPITKNDNYETLSEKLFKKGAQISLTVIKDYLEKKISPLAQNHKEATYTKLLTRNDGYIDCNKESLKKISIKFKAYYPWPGIWTFWQGKRLKITGCQFLQGKLIINKLQIEGKKEMSLTEFQNGYPDFHLF